MIYREFGKSGVQVSALGFGCMRLPLKGKDPSEIDEKQAMKMIRHAIDLGVNYFDTAYPYHGSDFSKAGTSEPFLARALGDGYREKVCLATKLPSWLVESREDMDRFLDEQLRRLETDRIDFYLLHALNSKTWKKLMQHNLFDFLESALKRGKIGYAGFSFHDELPLFKEIVDAYDWSFCQIMYNYYDEHFQAGREGMDYAAERGLGVVAMEPLRGGSLVNGLPSGARRVMQESAPGRSEVEWAFRWLWSQPEVSVLLSGMSDMEQVTQNLELAGRIPDSPWSPEEDATIGKVRDAIRSLQRVDCTSCGYCMPCPHGINIPMNFTLCNDHHMLNDPSARLRYNSYLNEEERASGCTECGECEEKCPQQIPIREELKYVGQLFS